MHLSDTFTFQAAQLAVWDALMDIEGIAAALGVHRIVPLAGRAQLWRATIRFKWLLINSTASYLVQMSEVNAPHSYRLTVSGEGRQSLVSGTGVIRLNALSNTHTRLDWHAESAFAPALQRVAQPLIKQTVSTLSRTFFSRLAAYISAQPKQQVQPVNG